MRASFAAVLVVLLLAPTLAAAHGGHTHALLHRQATAATWWSERFHAPSTFVVDLETFAGAGAMSHTLLLYDGDLKRLSSLGVTNVYRVGDDADVGLAASGTTVSSEDVSERVTRPGGARDRYVVSCSATCNPSRIFVLVLASAADNLTTTGFTLDVPDGSLLASTTGTDAHVVPARKFGGAVALAGSGAVNAGVGVAAATLQVVADDKMVGAFFGNQGAGTLSVTTPTTSAGCPCSFSKGSAGTWTFRIDDTNVNGDEAFLVYSDVRFS